MNTNAALTAGSFVFIEEVGRGFVFIRVHRHPTHRQHDVDLLPDSG
jgi:hypothetical protein